MNNNGNRYNEDFQKMTVRPFHSSRKIKDLSGECGVSRVPIYLWIEKFWPTPNKEKVVKRDTLLERDFSTQTINENVLAISRILTH